MSELKERLERLADLGTPRGAEAIWRRAQDAFVVRPTPGAVRPGRRRRVWAAVALSVVVALVAAGLSYLLAGRNHTTMVSVPPGRRTDSLVLVRNGSDQFSVVDVATGASRLVTLPGKVGGDFIYDVVATGGYFVYQSAQGVVAIPTALDRAPHLVGRASVYLPSSRPGRVWLFSLSRGGVPTQGQEVSVDGRYRGPRYRLPFAGAATVAVDGGLIRGDTVWSTATNTTRVLPGAPNVFDAHGSLVAWGAQCQPTPLPGCASLEVLNLTTNQQRSYPAPAGTAGWIPTGGEGSHDAFAPDGQHLALRVALTAAPLSSQVFVLNLATGAPTLVPHSQARAYSPVAWTPDGRSVLFENDTSTLGAYQPADATSRTLPAPCCGTLVTALNPPRVPPSTSKASSTQAGVKRPATVVAARDDGRLVVLSSTTGRVLRTLARATGGVPTVAVTPDGATVFFDRPATPSNGCVGREIDAIPTTGGPATRVAAAAAQPTVSPDGRHLAFLSYQGPDGCRALQSLVTMPLPTAGAGGPGWTVPNRGQTLAEPSWAPDSRHIAYVLIDVDTSKVPRILDTTQAGATIAGTPYPQRDGTGWFGYLGTTGDFLGDTASPGTQLGGPVTVVALDATTGAIRSRLFATHSLGTPDQLGADLSGQHILGIVANPKQPHVPLLYRWSRGDPAPTKLANHIIAAAWITQG